MIWSRPSFQLEYFSPVFFFFFYLCFHPFFFVIFHKNTKVVCFLFHLTECSCGHEKTNQFCFYWIRITKAIETTKISFIFCLNTIMRLIFDLLLLEEKLIKSYFYSLSLTLCLYGCMVEQLECLNLTMVNLSGKWFLDVISLGRWTQHLESAWIHIMVRPKHCEQNWLNRTF